MTIGPVAQDADPGAMQALVGMKLGRSVDTVAWARATPSGLASIGLLVSSILLSTAVLVWVARRPR
ncbi:hypothetical protein [Plastoroseomonas arctica]|uniref:Uncharacterized protein n=1 Tax=Plastoroseomonas arctica TaxID=1509237 RepID=A0AAF1KJP2_9PROT|nr:hypothetical protein [Plastoroseomonas arctica]MBR0655545.1 hypothetical protein [Plastoroseomonas arctica]